MSERVLAFSMAIMGCTLGCSAIHPSDTVTSGVYGLSVEAASEECSPGRAVGVMGDVAVLVHDGVIDLPVPEMEGPIASAPRVALAPETSFHTQTNRGVPGCEGAWVREAWTVVGSAPLSLELVHTQEWEGLDGCTSPSAPAADCLSARQLSYELLEACPETCRLEFTSAGGAICSC